VTQSWRVTSFTWLISSQAVLAQPAADRLVGVYDVDTGAPLADVQIVLLSSGLEWRTSTAGTAVLRNVPAGDHILRLRRPGYRPQSEFVSFSRRDTLPLTLLLRPLPELLPSVVVNAREEQYERRLSGFLSRRRAGIAPASSFITEADLRKWGAVRWSETLARIPGVQTDAYGNIALRRCGRFALYLDGALLSSNALEFIPLNTVAAIEIYRGAAQIPSQFNATGRACGAVVVWTK
jgi:TonB-dependent receptor-like protein